MPAGALARDPLAWPHNESPGLMGVTTMGHVKDSIAAAKQLKAVEQPRWAALLEAAHAAGRAAAAKRTPTPMVVTQHANPLDDASAPVQQWYEPGGPCGFAWVDFRAQPGGESRRFVNWLAVTQEYVRDADGRGGYVNSPKTKRLVEPCIAATKKYNGGLEYWVSDYGQSVELKEAYATAFADAMRDAVEGLRVHADSRLD